MCAVIDASTESRRAPRRADALDNRARLLTTAREVFAEHGVEASLRDVARRAGVGIGTLYRHFPDRQALLEALFADALHDLSETARHLVDDPSPGAALIAWLTQLASGSMVYRGLPTSVLAAVHDEGSALHAACREMTAGIDTLVRRARQSGALRGDVTTGDLLALAAGVAVAAEYVPGQPDLIERLVRLAATGFLLPDR
ncbi:TetR/AcrR family transcriptional regulator [Nocardia sp. alder85J]|uniref:TetR/AcrR family transcriptional regulator n=1 Tax=Nocardia sp. alder85J TaxID=2862949 RepID=UPI001CD2854D|nr:TetR/AcrR family transcriptional regulator [Nocardia sp. alder85J]MCX4091260.1 helix-turn-helix domain containing protein [Nocardia sp. alder85J]